MKVAATLSPRETQIAELIAWGSTKKDIANRFLLSERTIENHTRAIYKKVGVSKANELSAWWFCVKYKISFTDSPLLQGVLFASSVTSLVLSALFKAL